MKYFTPELLGRIASDDDDEMADAHDEWERAILRSNRRWAKIKDKFPEGVQRFEESSICLHDAELLQMIRDSGRAVMVLRLEPPRQEVVVLSFDLAGELEIVPDALPGRGRSGRIFWLYEEFDVDRRGTFTLEILFNNGWLVKVPFSDFQYLVGEAVAPSVNGQTAPATRTRARRA